MTKVRLLKMDGGSKDRFLLLLVVLAGLVAAGLMLLRQVNYGIGLEPDSIGYLAAARNLADGNGLVMASGWPLALWAPLFPVLTAIPGFFGLDALPAASLVNAAAIGGLVFVAGWRLRRSVGATLPAVWGTLAVMLSIPVNQQGYQAVSEPVFLLCTTLALTQAERFLDGGKRSALVWAGVFTALACLARYIGVSIIITVVVLLLLNSDRLTEKAKNVGWYAVIPVVVLGAWMGRNWLLTGFVTGNRPASDKTVADNLTAAAEVLASWALPGAWSEGNLLVAGLLALLVLAPAAGAGVLAVRHWRQRGRLCGVLAVPVAFAVIYIVLLAASGSVTLLAELDNRLMAPAYVPLVFAAAGVLGWWLRRDAAAADAAAGQQRRRRLAGALRLAPVVGLFLWLVYPAAANVGDIQRAITEGTGQYSNARWVDSDLLGYMAEQLEGLEYGRLHSNNEQLPYFYAGVPAVFLPYDRSELYRIYQNRMATEGIYVAWFVDERYGGAYRRGYSREELEESLPAASVLLESGHGVLLYVDTESIRRDFDAVVGEIGAPAASGVYDVYLGDKRLLYGRESCGAGDTAARFYLHIVPADVGDLPGGRRGYGFANRDFDFDDFGLRIGERCLISVPLPEWEFTVIRTGQFTGAGRIWESEFEVGVR